MIKVKNSLLILCWVVIPTVLYFVQANGLLSTADWSVGLLKLKNLLFYGVWPVLPLVFASKPKFQFVHDKHRKWRNEVPVKNNYHFFGVFGLFTLMAVSLTLYLFRSTVIVLPSELLVAAFLALGIMVYRTHSSNTALQQFFAFSSDLDYDYNDLYLQLKKIEEERTHTVQEPHPAVANSNLHT